MGNVNLYGRKHIDQIVSSEYFLNSSEQLRNYSIKNFLG